MTTQGLFGPASSLEDAAVVVVPVPFGATASEGHGASHAAARVLAASTRVQRHDPVVDSPWQRGIAALPVSDELVTLDRQASTLVRDRGPASEVDDLCEAMNEHVYELVSAQLAKGRLAAVLGGDHSVAFGAIRAAAERFSGLGVLHIDAHANLADAHDGYTWSHQSVMFNVHQRLPSVGHIVSAAIRDFSEVEAERIARWPKLTAFTDHELAWQLANGEPWLRIVHRVLRPLPRDVWVTLDVHGLQPALCPATGDAVPGGLDWAQVTLLLQALTQNHRIVGFDVCEVGDGEVDANVGARLLYRMAGFALSSG